VKDLARKPAVTVVVVVYNIPREAPRTLYSLSAAYQRHIDPDDYEVIVVDNGSTPPVDPSTLDSLQGNFRLIRIDPAPRSPAHAVNRGLAEARGDVIGIMIDGARIVTPGLLHFARHGASLYPKAVVATLGWYLGHDFQRMAMRGGYNQAREDALLKSIDWPADGYRLFEIGTMDESSLDGWFQPIAESNALFLRREFWDHVGGLDERFDAPGGGLVNLDTFLRIMESPGAALVVLTGEATFHQLHGGISTNAIPAFEAAHRKHWWSQYEFIRGRPFVYWQPTHRPTYIGTLPPAALARMVRAAVRPAMRSFEEPLGAAFDKELWRSPLPAGSPDPIIAGLNALAEKEFRLGNLEESAAVACLIRESAPDEPSALRLISLSAPCLTDAGPPPSKRPAYHLALAEAHRIRGGHEAAASHYRAALTFEKNLPQAHLGLAALRMPGDDYIAWLERLYGALGPETVIEIGVFEGASLALLRPPTVAIGVDPSPAVRFPLHTATHLFAETSDEFFAHCRPDGLLAGRPLSAAFIDGLHLYEQALRDFINLEAYCGPRSVVMIHDTVPLNESTQTRTKETQFHTGDVWKLVLCLKLYRPDLDIFTIPAFPAGLTIVTGLDPGSRLLQHRYDEAVARFLDTPFSAIENRMESALNVVSNDWSMVQSRLRDRRII
jgi:hypothetical protein